MATYYTIGAGDTLGNIAAYYGVSTATLAAMNGIRNPNVIKAGQRAVEPQTVRIEHYLTASPAGGLGTAVTVLHTSLLLLDTSCVTAFVTGSVTGVSRAIAT